MASRLVISGFSAINNRAVVQGGEGDASERAKYCKFFPLTFLVCDRLEEMIEILGCVTDISFDLIIGEPDKIKYNFYQSYYSAMKK
jgi:hypothetical protein